MLEPNIEPLLCYRSEFVWGLMRDPTGQISLLQHNVSDERWLKVRIADEEDIARFTELNLTPDSTHSPHFSVISIALWRLMRLDPQRYIIDSTGKKRRF